MNEKIEITLCVLDNFVDAILKIAKDPNLAHNLNSVNAFEFIQSKIKEMQNYAEESN